MPAEFEGPCRGGPTFRVGGNGRITDLVCQKYKEYRVFIYKINQIVISDGSLSITSAAGGGTDISFHR